MIRTTAAVVLSAGFAAALATAFDGPAKAVATAATATTTGSALASYSVDRVHSNVVFNVRHAGVANFYGRFNDFDGSFTFDPESPSNGSFDFTVQTSSIDTGNRNRDDHLRNADFFNARQFPTITFKSTGIREAGDGFELTGDLTMMGETKPVTAELDWIGTGSFRGKDVSGFEARFNIKRTDFGMDTYVAPDGGEGGGLGNTVNLIVAVEGVRS